MSDTFALPPFIVDYDIRWIPVDLDGDLTAWARTSAQDVLARWGSRGGRREKNLAKLLEEAGKIARRAEDASMAYLLYPVLGESIRAVVRVLPVDMRGHDEHSGWAAMLAWLAPPEHTGLTPEVTGIPTRAGPCKRIRFQEPGSNGAVIEQLAYTWVFPRYGAGVVMTGALNYLRDAEQWRPAVDELAARAGLDETATQL